MATDFLSRSDAIEECYEFLLAYAGQGVAEEKAEVRKFLERASGVMTGIAQSYHSALREAGIESFDQYQDFMSVLDRDAADSRAAIQMVLAQPVISSQLVDNLNASIHVRALLTDLFLLGEILISATKSATSAAK
jgi:hypothetical protein